GDERARRLVRQQLERERRALQHLPPAALVARLPDPAPPVGDGLFERVTGLLLRVGPRDVGRRHLLEDERRGLARRQAELAADAVAGVAQRDRGLKREREIGGA